MLSKKIADGVGFSFVADKLECFSYYGAAKIRELNAAFFDSVTLNVLRGSINLAEIFCNMSKLMELSQSQVAEIQDALSNFKNIGGIVKKLEFACLLEVDFFEVKRFLLGLEKFIGIWIKADYQLKGIHFTEMTETLNILDTDGQRSAAFFISDDRFPSLKTARQEKTRIEALIDKHGMTDDLMRKRAAIVAEEDKHEQAALKSLTDKLRPHVSGFVSNMENIGMFDFTLAKTVLAKRTGATCPRISTYNLFFTNMWNPKTQAELEKRGRVFTKTSIELQPGVTVLIGANMGGKSITIKTALLNVMLANMGFFVFADAAEVPVYDDVFLIEEGVGDDFLSSFGAEIKQINEVVKRLPGSKFFALLDEPVRTTNPFEGTKIVRGIVSYLAKFKSTCLVSTHYDNVQNDAQEVYQAASFSYEGINGANAGNLANFIKYELRKVGKNEAVPTEAINLCKILGMDEALLAEIDR